ncbi:NAD(P)-dependent oxidoreductase [Microbacterium sp. YY-01]|uniref:NAD(P)-dependent oxidoreductase n=1 Tax=Microbacterium sp. YY-01 TaxID=3421634 RepID=UPI003D179F20
MPAALPTIAFVGAGAIGLPMAQRLIAADFPTTGVDPFPAAQERARTAGVAMVGALSDVEAPDIVIVMVATPDQLETLIDDAAATLSGRPATWVIMSTVGPEAVTAAATRLAETGARVVDAPVTGGVARARTGELTIFTSGDPEAVALVTPALSAMGVVRTVGDAPGRGQAVKVVNQHLCSVHIVAAAEALALTEKLGLDPAEILPLLESGAAGSWMLSDRGPRMLEGTEVEVASQISIFVKDAGLVATAARDADAATPLLDIAQERFTAAAAAGLARRDDSRVIETYTHPQEQSQ